MRGVLSGYYRPTDADLKALWESGIVVLDANVLLNLYRYPESAREEMLTVLRDLGDRLWLPFHAALEFQRNRPAVLKEQKDRFQEVMNIATKAKTELTGRLDALKIRDRHSLIDATNLTSVISQAVDDFVLKLRSLETEQVEVHQADSLLSQIDDIVHGKIGTPPTQHDLDAIKKTAAVRSGYDMPPALQDKDKEKSNSPRYSYGGLYYEASLGDLYLWNQVIEFATASKPNGVIFITDDRKSDWWHIVESSGKKTLGPRPELVEEFQRSSGVPLFYMYQADQFLRHAKDQLAAKVSDESIEQVRVTATSSDLAFGNMREVGVYAEQAVCAWLQQGSSAEIRSDRFGPFDFIASEDGRRDRAYEVLVVRSPQIVQLRLRDRVHKAFYELSRGELETVTIVVVALGEDEARSIANSLRSRRFEIPSQVDVVVGWIGYELGDWAFASLERLTENTSHDTASVDVRRLLS